MVKKSHNRWRQRKREKRPLAQTQTRIFLKNPPFFPHCANLSGSPCVFSILQLASSYLHTLRAAQRTAKMKLTDSLGLRVAGLLGCPFIFLAAALLQRTKTFTYTTTIVNWTRCVLFTHTQHTEHTIERWRCCRWWRVSLSLSCWRLRYTVLLKQINSLFFFLARLARLLAERFFFSAAAVSCVSHFVCSLFGLLDTGFYFLCWSLPHICPINYWN